MLLTPRQTEVLKLLAEGYTFKEIGWRLHIAPMTAVTHKDQGMERLGFTSRVELIQYALKVGWLKSSEATK